MNVFQYSNFSIGHWTVITTCNYIQTIITVGPSFHTKQCSEIQIDQIYVLRFLCHFCLFDEWERPFLCNWINVGSSESIRYQSRYMAAKCIGNKLCSTDVRKYINTNCETYFHSWQLRLVESFYLKKIYQSWVLHVLLLFRPP